MSTEPVPHVREIDGEPPATVEGLLALLQRLELAAHDQRAARARQQRAQHVEMLALEHLVALGGLTPGQLGKRLGLTSGGVTALAERLADAGFVTRRRHPHDRRMRVLIATQQGEQHLRAHVKPIEAPAERTFSWLSEVDREVAGRLFQSLVALKEQAAAQTPDPEHAPEGERYSPSLLM